MPNRVHQDPLQRLQAEADALRLTLDRLSCGTPLPRFLADLCLDLERLLEEGLCSIHLLGEDRLHIRRGVGPSLPEAYMDLIEGAAIGPRTGSCGTAMFTLQRVVVEDIGQDPRWEAYRQSALPFGLRACASVPIIDSEGKALGAFAIYHTAPGPFSEADLSLLHRFTDVAALAIRINRREARLRTEELRHRALVEQSGDGIYYFDAESGAILEANRAFSDLLGYGPGELERMSLFDLVAHDPATVRFNIQNVRHQGAHSIGERNYRHRDGSLIPVEVSAAPLDLGDRVVFSVIARDVRARNEAQAALRQSEALLREAQRLGRLGHWSFDLATQQIHWSETIFEIFDRDPALGPPGYGEYLASIHPEDRDAHAARVARAMAGEADPGFDLRTLTRDGQVRWHRGQVHPAFEEGRVVRLYGVAQDITERKVAEARLQALLTDLQAVMDQASDGIFVADASTRYVNANRRALDMVGYSLDELRQRRIRDLIPPEERDQMPERLKALDDGLPYLVERLLVRKDGSRFVAEISARRLQDGRYLSICRDVTARREAEERLKATAQALADSESRFRIVAEQTGQLVYDADLRSGAVIWEGAIERLTGYDHHEFPARNLEAWATSIHPEDRPEALRALARARASLAPYHATYRIRRKDGSWLPMEDRGVILPGEDGSASRMLGTMSDISAREEARERQAQSERSFRHLFDLNPAPMVLSRPKDGVILLANEAAYRMFQLTPAEVEHKRTVDFFAHPEDRKRLLAELAQQGRVSDFALEMVVHGAHRQVLLSAGMPEYLGQTAILVALTDITDRAREEEARRQSQKLESLGLLAGGIAHDFNNLLTSMLGNLGLAQLHLSETHPSAPYLADMERVIQRAADLARQMLAYSGRGRFRQEPIDLNALVQELTHLLSVGVSKRIQLRTDLDAGLPQVLGDPVQLQQVVMNLVTNAAEAIGDRNGFIRVSTELCTLDGTTRPSLKVGQGLPDGDYLCLEIQDSGQGMTSEVMARIFDPFFTTKATGRGLGLSALLGILNGHKAGLSIETTPGEGTRFRVWFTPLPGTPKPAPPPPAPEAVTRYRGRALVVDDEAAIRASASGLLQHLGFEVEEAADGVEAMARLIALDGAVALILLDLTMPHMDGREVLQQVRARWPALPVILSSGYSEQAEGLDLGGAGTFLPKPYRVSELKAALEKVLAT